MVKQCIYKFLHWTTFITKLVTVTLVLFRQNFLEDKLWLSATALTGISALLLGIGCILGIKRKCRENTPPIVTIILIGICGGSTIAEVVIFGLRGFKDGLYNPLMSAIFCYDILCLLTIIILMLLIIIRPPVVEDSQHLNTEIQVVNQREISQRRLPSSKEDSSRKSKKSRK